MYSDVESSARPSSSKPSRRSKLQTKLKDGKVGTKLKETKTKIKENAKETIQDAKDQVSPWMKIQMFVKDPYKFIGSKHSDGLVTMASAPLVGLLAVTGIGSGVAAMIFTVSSIVNVASVSLFALGPLVVYQKIKLHGLGGLRAQITKMKMVRAVCFTKHTLVYICLRMLSHCI